MLAYCFSLISSRLEQILMTDQIDAAVFGVHFSGVAQVPGYVCRVLHLPALLYVLSALGVALSLLGFSQ
jgi:hypothetical protein